MHRVFPALIPALALAACSNEAQAPAPDATETAASAGATVDGAAVESSVAPVVEPSAAPEPGASLQPAAAMIPNPAKGRWGMVPADCEPGRSDNKGMMTVADKTIRFYESVATLKTVKEATPDRIRATFAYEGEGMQWNRDMSMDVQDGGKTLILREYGDDAPAGPRKYSRCS